VAESNDAATATEQAFANAFSGAEDSLVGFINTGKLEFRGLADSILADLARTTVHQTLMAPLAGALQSAFAGGGPFGQFHEGGIAGELPPALRYVDAAVFEHAQRYHGGGFAGSGLLPDQVPIIARRGELVVPPERVVREEKSGLKQRSDRPSSDSRERRPISVVVNVTAADASSFRASPPLGVSETAEFDSSLPWRPTCLSFRGSSWSPTRRTAGPGSPRGSVPR
jgi:hypothetical protein